MIPQPLNSQSSTNCTLCGAEIVLNEHAARYAHKGIICPSCMRTGRKWVGTKAYEDYLKTAHWKAFRLRALDRAGRKCQVCAKKNRLDVHHNDYSRVGGELMTDVVVLCHSCHKLFHGDKP